MKTEKIKVENVTCNSCATAIKRQLGTIKGVESVSVNIPKGIVTVEHDGVPHYIIAITLDDLGYPEIIKK